MMREYTVEVTTKGWEAFQMCEFVCIVLTVLAKNSDWDGDGGNLLNVNMVQIRVSKNN